MTSPYEEYRRAFAARAARRDAERRALAESLRARLPAAATLLRERYGARRVGVFGSLAAGTVDEDSDVDLFVDAVREGSYWRALSDLADLFGRPVDLIELEDASESLRQAIAEDGTDVP